LWLIRTQRPENREAQEDHGHHRQRTSAGGVDTPPELRAGILSPADVALACEDVMDTSPCECGCICNQDPRTPFTDRDEMRTWRITISANRETSRLGRMADVARRVFSADPSVGDKIHMLHDHKGALTVTWFRPPTQHDQQVVAQAWEGENEYEVNHEWYGRSGRSGRSGRK